MIDSITVRQLGSQDVDEVLELLRASLGEPPLLRRTRALFAWKHFDNPFGRSLALVAEAGGRIAGLRAFMRWELEAPDGTTLRCVRAVDTATHPDFQRRGIFRRLTLEALEWARADGVDLVFNTPNQKSGAGYLSMGWERVGRIGVMVRPSLRWLRRGATGAPGQAGELLDADSAGALPVGGRPTNGLRTPRTKAYLRWRFASHPTARYYRVGQDDGVAVIRPNVRSGRHETIVADLFGSRPVDALRQARRASKADYLVTWFPPGSPERRAALRNGLVPVPGVAALTLVAHPLRQLPLDVTTPAAWDLAISDLELL